LSLLSDFHRAARGRLHVLERQVQKRGGGGEQQTGLSHFSRFKRPALVHPVPDQGLHQELDRARRLVQQGRRQFGVDGRQEPRGGCDVSGDAGGHRTKRTWRRQQRDGAQCVRDFRDVLLQGEADRGRHELRGQRQTALHAAALRGEGLRGDHPPGGAAAPRHAPAQDRDDRGKRGTQVDAAATSQDRRHGRRRRHHRAQRREQLLIAGGTAPLLLLGLGYWVRSS